MKNKLLIAILSASILFILGHQKVLAYEYGGEEPTAQIIVDKQVKPNIWSNWYDNISAEAFSFVAADKADYKIIVKNSGDKDLVNIKVKDTLPGEVSFLSATEGNSQNGRDVKWTIDKLVPGETKELFINAQIVDSESLKDKANFCTSNYVSVQAESGESDEDWAQICIESRVLGAQTLPEAGVPVAAFGLGGLALSGLGVLLKKKAI